MYLKPSPPPETARTPNLGWEQKAATVKQELESQEERLKEWERRLAQREQQLGERERQLAERERQLKEKEQQLAQLGVSSAKLPFAATQRLKTLSTMGFRKEFNFNLKMVIWQTGHAIFTCTI